MNFFDNWERLIKLLPPGKNEFLDSQRRYLANRDFQKLSFKNSTFLGIRYLLLVNNNVAFDDSAVIFIGGLKEKVNAGRMLEKVHKSGLNVHYEVVTECFFLNNNSIKFKKLFSTRILNFIYYFFSSINQVIALKQRKLINFKEVFALLIYRNAFLCYLIEQVKNKNLKFFLTYNDYLPLSSELSVAFRKMNKNVYHVQHGILSSVNFPGLSNYFILWGRSSYDIAKKLGYKSEHLVVLGAACFENNACQYKSERTLVFFSQSWYVEHTGLAVSEAARDWIFQAASLHPEWKFIIRLHPNAKDGNFYAGSANHNNVFLEFANEISIGSSIDKASICATIWSGAGLDAIILGKPLVILSPCGFIQRHSWAINGCFEAKNYNDFEYFIVNSVKGEWIKSILSLQKNVLLREVSDFNAEDKIANFILKNEQNN